MFQPGLKKARKASQFSKRSFVAGKHNTNENTLQLARCFFV